MDGFSFIKKLQDLKIPGTQSLLQYDYDWIFCDKKNQHFISFFEWVCSNVTENDLLTDEELKEYEKQLTNGSVLSGNHLEQMEAYLEPFSSDFDTTNLNVCVPDTSEQELNHLEEELQLLIKRKNHLSIHKMAMKENLNKKEIWVKSLNSQFEQDKSDMESLCEKYSQTVAETSSSLDKISSEFILFKNKTDENEAVFISQLPVSKWQKEELAFKESVFNYINKQFQEGVEVIAGQNDASLYCLLDAGQIDIQLVRGPKQSEYITNVKELNRISKLLEETEINRVEYEILRVQKHTEMEEARKFMKMIKAQPSYSHPLLKQKILEIKEARQSVDTDLKYQCKYLKEQAIIVSQLERLKTISGNYEVKIKRQEYFLGKQEIVINHLLYQLARQDFMKIVLDNEKNRIQETLEVLGKLSTFLKGGNQGFIKRMSLLKSLEEELDQTNEAFLGDLLPFKQLLQPLELCFGTAKLNFVCKLVTNVDLLESSLNSAEKQAASVTKAQMTAISKVLKSCVLLEDCLFGEEKVLGTLPNLWINSNVINKQADVEKTLREFQQKMLNVLRDYEGKKKILQENVAVQEKLYNWTGSVINMNLK